MTRPPVDAAAALSAATEVCASCPDAVDQGAEALENLTTMISSRGWWLWWDQRVRRRRHGTDDPGSWDGCRHSSNDVSQEQP